MGEKTEFFQRSSHRDEKAYDPAESFNHNGKIKEEQLDKMIKEAHAMLEQHMKEGKSDKAKIDRNLIERYENQKLDFHSN